VTHELDSDWQDHEEDIEVIRAELRDALVAAHSAVSDAMRKIDELRGDGVFDVEYEGTRGRDMARQLDTAAVAIRAAQALNPVKAGADQR